VNLQVANVKSAREAVAEARQMIKNAEGQSARRTAETLHDEAVKALKEAEQKLTRATRVDPPPHVSKAQKQAWNKFKAKHIAKGALPDNKLETLMVPADVRKAALKDWNKMKDGLITRLIKPVLMGEGSEKEYDGADTKALVTVKKEMANVKTKSTSELINMLKGHLKAGNPLGNKINALKLKVDVKHMKTKPITELLHSLKKHLTKADPLVRKINKLSVKAGGDTLTHEEHQALKGKPNATASPGAPQVQKTAAVAAARSPYSPEPMPS